MRRWTTIPVRLVSALLCHGAVATGTAAAQGIVTGPSPRACSNKAVQVLVPFDCVTRRGFGPPKTVCHYREQTEIRCLPFIALGRVQGRSRLVPDGRYPVRSVPSFAPARPHIPPRPGGRLQ